MTYNKTILFMILIIAVLAAGCGDKSDSAPADDAADGLADSGSVSSGASWCAAGEDWKLLDLDDEGLAPGDLNIIGLENEGKFSGLCRVRYKSYVGNDQLDYFFNQDGTSGYYKTSFLEREWRK